MQIGTRLLILVSRWTRWTEGQAFAFTPEQIGVVEGLRASFAIAAILAADLWLQVPDFAWGAVAAFWTCLCDPGGSEKSRLKVLTGFAVFGTAIVFAACYGAHWGPFAGGGVLACLVLLCGLTRSYQPGFGPMPPQIGLIAAIAAVVAIASPRSFSQALEACTCFLIGSLWAVLLCVYLWRTQPDAPVRRALITIFARLDDMAASLLRLDARADVTPEQWSAFRNDHLRSVRIAIERGREAVARLPVANVRYRLGIDTAGRVFAALLALGHHRAAIGKAMDPDLERPLVEGLRSILETALDQLAGREPDGHSLLRRATGLASRAKTHPGLVGKSVAASAEAVADLGRHWQQPDRGARASAGPSAGFAIKISAPVWRHALRMTVAVSISYAIGTWLDLTFSYWGTIATLVIMQPLGANTRLRIIERATGSIIGGVLTAVLISKLTGPVEMLIFIAPLSAAVIALRLVNYTLFLVFLTPMFVLVSDFIHPASHLISARAINEVIGAGVGLIGSLVLWPDKQSATLDGLVLAALTANLRFAAAALRAGPDALDAVEPQRRDAGVTSSRAEAARQRALLERRFGSSRLDHLTVIFHRLRAVCGAATVLAIMKQTEPSDDDRARAGRYDALAALLEQQIRGVEHPIVPSALPDIPGQDDLDSAVRSLVAAIQD
ncbi:MAG: hypothetical protein JWQ94_1093 [Tardiphaga sp.]|nr:hypothetical protein [Tardiphaga sp.]